MVINNKDIVEGFCPACLAVPLAVAGMSASAYGYSSRDEYKKKKKITMIGVIITLISLIIMAYYYFSSCSECISE